MRRLEQFRFSEKIWFAALLLMVPLAALGIFYLREADSYIKQTAREQAGIRDLQALLSFDSALPDRADQALTATAQERLMRLPVGDRDRLEPEWVRYTENFGQTQEQRQKDLLQLHQTVLQLTAEHSDAGALLLDNQADTFPLIDAGAFALPQAQADLREVLTLPNSAPGTIPERAHQLADSFERVRLERIRTDIDAFSKSGAGQDQTRELTALNRSYSQAAAAFTNELASGANATSLGKGFQAEHLGYDLWSAVMATLQQRLSARLFSLRLRMWSVLAVCALAAIGASALLGALIRTVSRNLQALTQSAELIARGEMRKAQATMGDLPPDWGEERDELTLTLHAMRIMNVSLSVLLEQVLSAKNTVRAETDRVAGSVQMLQAVISQQAASTRQMTGTSNDILRTVRELSGTMEALNLRAGRTADSAASGISLLSSITTSVDRLGEAARNLRQALETIHNHSSRIDTVLNTIVRVANRTNILSLNASIEAETSGAAVRGFSAIALQTRQLADQTAISTLNIEQVIREMQSVVREGTAAFEQHLTRTQAISGLMVQASTAMAGILGDTRAVAEYVQSIHTGMQVQSKSAGQIADAAGQLLGAAEHTRESVGALGLATEQLPAAVQILELELGRFQISG